MMNYFEFVYPYYALIKAQTEEEAAQEYINVIAGEQSDFEMLVEEAKVVPEYYAAARYSRTLSEDKKLIDLDEILDDLKRDEKQVLIIDGSLL